jgi:hypothetical protein
MSERRIKNIIDDCEFIWAGSALLRFALVVGETKTYLSTKNIKTKTGRKLVKEFNTAWKQVKLIKSNPDRSWPLLK